MSFKETPRLPEGLSAGSRYGPGYSTRKAYNLGGFRAANQNWSMPLYEGDVGYAVKNQADLDDLLAFFHGVRGIDGFRFKNWNDYTAAGSEGTVVQLTSTTWQMYKTYIYGALSPTRKITKPVSGTIVVAGGGSYSVDSTTGIITNIGSPVIAATGWVGQFDDPVEFTTDKMLPMWISFELYEWTSIPIRELRL